jgi:flavin-dependent dehydrogenase
LPRAPIPEDALIGVRGYRLPLRRPGFAPVRGRTALVGDAAGLVDPVSGDGIYEALLSARLAAENALEIIAGNAADFRSYAGKLDRALALSAAASWRAKLALERFPNLSFTLLQAPYAWRAMEKLLRADATHPGAIGGPGGAALRAAELLARVAGDPGRAFARPA